MRKIICLCYHCPKHIACLVFGNDHKPHHRIITGSLIILLGTWISGLAHHGVAGTICEAGGYFIHGMGSVPIIEHLGKVANTPSDSHETVKRNELTEIEWKPVTDEV